MPDSDGAGLGTRSPAARGLDVLIPATMVQDREDARLIVEHAIPAAAGALRHGVRTARLMQEAASVFLDNVEQHARSRPVPPVALRCLPPTEQRLAARLRQPGGFGAPYQSRRRRSCRGRLPGRGPATAHWTIWLLSIRGAAWCSRFGWSPGTGRAGRRSDASWKVTEGSLSVPALVAGLEVHRSPDRTFA